MQHGVAYSFENKTSFHLRARLTLVEQVGKSLGSVVFFGDLSIIPIMSYLPTVSGFQNGLLKINR